MTEKLVKTTLNELAELQAQRVREYDEHEAAFKPVKSAPQQVNIVIEEKSEKTGGDK